jgi:hypothetical protein
MGQERVEHGLVVKAPRDLEISGVARQGVELDEGVHHSPVLHGEHPLELLLGKPRRHGAGPVREL